MKIAYTDKQKKATETEKDTAVFYAGATYDGQNRYNSSSIANEYAKASGGTTINMNFEEQGIDWPKDQETGSQISKMYAENASGDVKVFLGEDDAYSRSDLKLTPRDERHPLNTWDAIECPTLLANENVYSITVYDPKMQEEVLACDRNRADGSTENMVKQYNKYLESVGSELRYGVGNDGQVRQCAEYSVNDNGHVSEEYDTTRLGIRNMLNGQVPQGQAFELTLENEND